MPLHWLARYGYACHNDSNEINIVRLLLNGANQNIPNDKRETAVDIYRRKYNFKHLPLSSSVSFVYDFVQPWTAEKCRSVKPSAQKCVSFI